MTADGTAIVQAITELKAAIHLQFAVLILVMLVIKWWKKGG